MAIFSANVYFRCETKPCIRLLVDTHAAGKVCKEIRGSGDLSKAHAVAREALTMQPDNPVLLLELGNCKLKLRQIDNAMRLFRKVSKIEPNRPHAFTCLGEAWIKAKNLDIASKQFRKALKIDPCNTSALNGIGKILFFEGRTEEAREYFLQSLAIDSYSPASIYALNLMGQTYLVEHNPATARECFLLALKVGPDNLRTHELIIRSYQEEGKIPAAKQWLEERFKTHPANEKLRKLSESISVD